jgi:hypothetical protein
MGGQGVDVLTPNLSLSVSLGREVMLARWSPMLVQRQALSTVNVNDLSGSGEGGGYEAYVRH